MSENIFLKNMGKRIFEKRKQLNLSQEEFAQIADVSPQLLSTAERGTKALRPENLLKISIALGVSTDYLLTGNVNDTDYGYIFERMKKIPSEKVMIIENIVDQCINLYDD